jgi:hypothetical protein
MIGLNLGAGRDVHFGSAERRRPQKSSQKLAYAPVDMRLASSLTTASPSPYFHRYSGSPPGWLRILRAPPASLTYDEVSAWGEELDRPAEAPSANTDEKCRRMTDLCAGVHYCARRRRP